MNIYNVETRSRITGTFTNAQTGGVSDPSTVTVTITPPTNTPFNVVSGSGTLAGVVGQTTVSGIRDSVGVYHVDIDITSPGVWEYQWQGTGVLIAASPIILLQAF